MCPKRTGILFGDDQFIHCRLMCVGVILAAAALFLAVALITRNNEHLRRYWLIPFAFFAALTAISVDYYVGLSQWITPMLGVEAKSPPGWAIDKLESSLLNIIIVLVSNRLANQPVDSLYIRRGRLWLGLLAGLIAFVVMSVSIIPVTELWFKGENLTWAPWVLVPLGHDHPEPGPL